MESLLDLDRGLLSRLWAARSRRRRQSQAARSSGENSISGHRYRWRNGRQPEPPGLYGPRNRTTQNRRILHGGSIETDDQQTPLNYNSSHDLPCLSSTTSGTFNFTTFCIRSRIVLRTESSCSGTSKISSSWT